ncbi:S41 family peptidase [Streptomyces sp. NPDC050610]|uniref:S41 family peptidase n=1 Tax=Streptomyces sp. NPDC050610 TaxID=3157097 RepID=UPI00343D5C8B
MSGPSMPARLHRHRRAAALTLVFASVLATGAAAGSWSGDRQNVRNTASAPTSARQAGSVDRDQLADAAAKAAEDGKSGADAAGAVVSRSGDRWAAVYSAREYEGLQQTLDGRYVGVGLWVRTGAGGRIEVDRVQPGSPAARSGLRAGDRLTGVDGTRVEGRPVTEVVALLRGADAGDGGTDRTDGGRATGAAAGTPVRLGLRRGGHDWDLSLRRARLATENVTVDRLHDGPTATTRIKVVSFTKGTGEQVRRAVRDAPRSDGILLDLRANSGGLVAEAVAASAAFLDGGLVATYDVHGAQRALSADPGGDTARPLAVLVDGGTMSAAELLTGALQDRGRAVVVGTRTFGKGSVQLPSELPDGSVAELTVGHYSTPAGRAVDGAGITPDLAAGGDAEQRARTVLSGLGGGA